MNARKPRKVPEFVDDLNRIATTELLGAGLPEADAKAVARRITSSIVSLYARTTMHVPVGYDARNAEIWRQYAEPGRLADGTLGAPPFSQARAVELAAEHNLTARQVYSILQVQRRTDRAERGFPSDQPMLKGLDAAS